MAVFATTAPTGVIVTIWVLDEAPGSNQGIVTVRPPKIGKSPKAGAPASEGMFGTAEVIVERQPVIEVSTEKIRFEAGSGGGTPDPSFVEMRNAIESTLSGLSVSVTYPSGGPEGWLSVDLSGTTAPANLRLEGSRESLTGGTYHTEVLVSAATASNTPVRIAVEFFVESRAPILVLAPTAVGFSAAEDRPLPSPQTVAVTNGGEGVLSSLSRAIEYQGDGPVGWLSAELESVSAPTNLRLSVSPGNLNVGIYEASVAVSSPDAANSPASVLVRLTIGDPPPEIELVPSSVVMTYVEDGAALPSETVEILNRSPGLLEDLSLEVEYASGPIDWLDLNLSSSSAPSVLTLSVQDGSLPLVPRDIYEAEVTITAPEAVNSPQILQVGLEVIPRPSPENSTINATPTAIVADGVSTSTVIVQLRDPRGDLLGFGGHVVALETTAGTLSIVTDNGNGIYTAALTSAGSPGAATISGTVNGAAIADEAEVVFVVGPASGATSTITASPSTIEADGASTSTITARLRDAGGNELEEGGDDVELLATRGSLSGVIDQGDGTYTATLTSATSPATATISGTVNGAAIADEAEVVFESSASEYQVTVSDETPEAGTEVTVTAQLADAGGNVVAEAGRVVNWSASGGAVLASASSTTNASGVATVVVTTSETVGQNHVVTATDDADGSITGSSPTITTQ